MYRSIIAVLFASLAALPAVIWSGGKTEPGEGVYLELKQGDRISIIGNTLADRMQHDGWLDTILHHRFPKLDLVIRNLGFAADELKTRPRSEAFGSPDHWLSANKANVIFAFFGYNESFAGKEGLPKFKADLEGFIKDTLKQKYNGNGPPRLVLFSPIAHENLKDRNLPDGTENNKRLEMYAAAMAEVAKTNSVVFVDLFQPTRNLYAKAKQPLTINGVHLNEHGNRLVAEKIADALFGKGERPDEKHLEKLRQAVVDRNFHWFNRYRTVDGYSIYGGRSHLKFVDDQTNRVVMQREMEILDLMTANRDKVVWGAARGAPPLVDDTNLPPFIEVKTNRPGKGPGGKHLHLSGEEAIKKMKLAKGLKVNLFASEKEFPELANPVQMSFDAKGRLWVAVWPTYPHWKPGQPMNDKLIILEDTDNDGKADKMTVFADNLHCPTGFEFHNGGVLVAQAPDLVFLKDTKGTGKADLRVRVLSGLDSADTHHTANSFVLDPGGALYFQEGVFHRTGVETPWGPPARRFDAGVYRYEPRTQKFDVYVAFGFANPHGHVFDRWGQDIVVDGTGANPFHATLFSGQVDFPHGHGRPPQVYKQRTRPCPGMEILSSGHFPEDMQGNLLVANVIDVLGILRYKLKDKGASFEGIEAEPMLLSSDPNFRPADLRVAPDGSIYFIDWQNPIIGHMQHNLRDPSRGHEHGRVYRIVHEDRPLLKPTPIAEQPIEKLLDILKAPEDRVRYRARIELGGRDSDKVLAAAVKWLDALDRKDAEYEHHRLEGLWLHQSHNVVNEDLLKQVLRSPDFRARAAATRVLCYWRDRVADPLGLLRAQINDTHPRVRLEAIRALSFFHDEKALNVALEMLAHPDDEYLRYTFNETLNTLERRLGSKLDRKNIAQSLVNMLEKGKVADDRKPGLIDTICRHGGPKELSAVWAMGQKVHGVSPALRKQILDGLTEAALTRRAQPEFEAGQVLTLLRTQAALQPEAIRLASAWKVKAAAADLRGIAADEKAKQESRFAAIDGLAILEGAENLAALKTLVAKDQAVPVRFRAAVALSLLDVDAGTQAAAEALASASDADDPSPVIAGILIRKQGADKLAAALTKEKISVDGAKRILRAMVEAGRNDAAMITVVTKLAGLDGAIKPPTAEEIRALATDAMAKGDATRGEKIFRRDDLGCVKCHAINKVGGNIGPDLGPIGGSSPIDYIIAAILDPSASIKEEYLTKTINTSRGLVVNGIVVERDKNVVVLKDGTGKLHRIPAADIEEEANGKSLMPDGITRVLTRAELLDLVRYVAELGKRKE